MKKIFLLFTFFIFTISCYSQQTNIYGTLYIETLPVGDATMEVMVMDVDNIVAKMPRVTFLTGYVKTTDLNASNTIFSPYLTIASTNVQAAIQELKDELDASGVAGNLDALTDVTITTPAIRHSLMYDGTSIWVNRVLVNLDISDFASGVSTNETTHSDVLVDGDFPSQGLMKRGISTGLYSIVPDNSSNWDLAFGWGDHSGAGYLTSFTELDPLHAASPASGISGAQITNWDLAFGWGDHSGAGYGSIISLVAGTNITIDITDPANPIINSSGGGATNLSYIASTRTITSDTGADAVITIVDGVNDGLMIVADKSKLDGVAAGATVDQDLSALETIALRELNTSSSYSTVDADIGKMVNLAAGATTITLSDDATISTGYYLNIFNNTGGTISWLYGTGDTAIQGTLVVIPDKEYAFIHYRGTNSWSVMVGGGSGTSGATNLSYTASPTNGIVNSDTGSDATLTVVDATNAGIVIPADKILWDLAFGWGDHSTAGYGLLGSIQTWTAANTWDIASTFKAALTVGDATVAGINISFVDLVQGTFLIGTGVNGYFIMDNGTEIFRATTGEILFPNLTIAEIDAAAVTSAVTKEWVSANTSGILNVAEDLTPQFGGDMDTQGYDITAGTLNTSIGTGSFGVNATSTSFTYWNLGKQITRNYDTSTATSYGEVEYSYSDLVGIRLKFSDVTAAANGTFRYFGLGDGFIFENVDVVGFGDAKATDVRLETSTKSVTGDILIGELNSTIFSTASTAVTYTLQDTLAVLDGSNVTIIQEGAGAVTIAVSGTATLNGISAGSITISAQYKGVQLIQRVANSDNWIAIGSF